MNYSTRTQKSALQMTRMELLDAFHAERSRCIDAFAAIEEAVISLLRILEIKSGGEPFSHKLEILRKAKPNRQFSDARLLQLTTLLPACVELNALRNDIVHARLQMAEIGGEFRACFTNARECMAGSQTARLFTLEGLVEVQGALTKLAVELNQILINPASSPRPPLPGAAGGP